MVAIRRFDVFMVALDPTVGSEIQKLRPCAVVSPDEMNRHLKTTLVCPLTSTRKAYPFRVDCEFEGRQGQLATDQLRTVDRSRLVRRLGRLDPTTGDRILDVLREMFAP